MSDFGAWIKKELDNVISGVKEFLTAMEPTAKAVALTAIDNGVSAFESTAGSISDKGVAARNAVESTAAASVTPLETTALHTAVALAVAANAGLLAAPAVLAP